jgi:hypothetical protein
MADLSEAPGADVIKHNFRAIFPNFRREKLGVFLENQWYDQFFA